MIKVDFSKQSELQEVDTTILKRLWAVASSSKPGIYYLVIQTPDDKFLCTCPGWQYRNNCTHIIEAARITADG